MMSWLISILKVKILKLMISITSCEGQLILMNLFQLCVGRLWKIKEYSNFLMQSLPICHLRLRFRTSRARILIIQRKRWSVKHLMKSRFLRLRLRSQLIRTSDVWLLYGFIQVPLMRVRMFLIVLQIKKNVWHVSYWCTLIIVKKSKPHMQVILLQSLVSKKLLLAIRYATTSIQFYLRQLASLIQLSASQ